MTKEDLIVNVAKKLEISKNEASKAVNATFDLMKESFGDGESLQIAGFGTFKVSERSERQGRNPKTGESITIPASKSIHFSNGKRLKELLNTK